MATGKTVKGLGSKPSANDSLRRSLKRRVDKSEGRMPTEDLIAIIKACATELAERAGT